MSDGGGAYDRTLCNIHTHTADGEKEINYNDELIDFPFYTTTKP
jgi:hypothetical protein